MWKTQKPINASHFSCNITFIVKSDSQYNIVTEDYDNKVIFAEHNFFCFYQNLID